MRQLSQSKANADLQPLQRQQPGLFLRRHESTKATHSGTLPMPETAAPYNRDYTVR
jgi:hypothetical protein